MNMAQDERPMLEENQKDEVAITVDGSKEATRQNQKQNDVASTTESLEPHKSKSTWGDENKQVNSKAKSNQTHARTYDEKGKDSESKTKSTDTGDTHILPWYHVSADGKITWSPMKSRRKELGEKYFTLTFSYPNPYPEFVGVDQDDWDWKSQFRATWSLVYTSSMYGIVLCYCRS
jgi:hypothetical protein